MAPESYPDYRPALWLPGPHAPTVFGKFFREVPPGHDRLERWPTPDDDELTLARLGTPRPGAPHLLLLHGLEGGPQSKYIRGLFHLARARGLSADLLVFRSCDGRINRQRRFYHSGETTDLDLVVHRLHAEHPGLDLRVFGCSLGGNVLGKWLGEQRHAATPLVTRAAMVSVPFDLGAGSRHLERGISRRYVAHFLKTLRTKVHAKRERFPDLCDWAALDAAQTFYEYDDVLTGPVHGFGGARDYYQRSSSLGFLGHIQVPTLLLSAVDDPFLPASVLDQVRRVARDNPALTIHFTPRGGHVGWIEGWPWDQRYWMESRVMRWLVDGV